MGTEQIFALGLFVLALGIISTEKIHRSIVAAVFAAFAIVFGFIHQESAIHAIDFNTIGLLVGMMIIVSIFAKTGFFEYLSLYVIRATKGSPMKILIALSLLTAVLSALLDNVTTILLIAPVIIFIAKTLKVSPLPLVLSAIFFSNIGGTATLIGDPPNVIIGSAANFSFMDFIVNVTPAVVFILAASVPIIYFYFRKQLAVSGVNTKQIMKLEPSKAIRDHAMLKKVFIVFGLTLIGFFTHAVFHLEAATIALAGAAVLLLLTARHPDDIYKEVEWGTIFFFLGLFVLVGMLEEVGVITLAAEKILEVTHGDALKTSMLMLWFSGISSGLVDNIPITTVMVGLIKDIGHTGIDTTPLWWSLSLGACLGGNTTLIGASANVVGADICSKNGTPISFVTFVKYGVLMSLVSFVLASVYIWLRYFILV